MSYTGIGDEKLLNQVAIELKSKDKSATEADILKEYEARGGNFVGPDFEKKAEVVEEKPKKKKK